MDQHSYKKYSEKHAKKTSMWKNVCMAFLIGGFICVFAQALHDLFISVGMTERTVKSAVPVTLIFLTCLLSGLGIFNKIAKVAGAGTLVPITGFANAVVSPALDYKAEGLVMGMGAKMFIIAGPVIVYGVLTSVIYGVIYYFFNYLR